MRKRGGCGIEVDGGVQRGQGWRWVQNGKMDKKAWDSRGIL
ncbi:hypothetical protein QG37_06216 [Candidozyma auris]|uniref:Uncharacterized protein n=1 Tax=Candidozyma auris TaxID=498019 RepID=A0A0L0NUD7_CANAR|nr:hypothetical protein QG37_06216 [[Candida] auris]